MTSSVLIADDDIAICQALERSLRFEGFKVRSALNGEIAIEEIEKELPDIMILDINMPEVDGIQVTKYLRSLDIDIPICILSARDEVSDRVSGLEAGADDYVIKPFSFEELLARIHALLRRRSVDVSKILTVGELTVDPMRRTAAYHGSSLDLTKKEFDLIHVLANSPSLVLSREQLLNKVWGYDFDVDTNVVDVFIGYLRKKMEINGQKRIIETVRGVGFVLNK
ncbi:MAG: DNA-binding response regulator [Chloroflexi bacterium]|nr:DNA-binding response regulator [Chloroflexota bacterium]MED6295823.1 response regulator transcription factor [Chloroflexota bacterium]|tara:strand:+ start:105 stop:779 length:675 start_codon:yes stop_codon:yes gene_type:complete